MYKSFNLTSRTLTQAQVHTFYTLMCMESQTCKIVPVWLSINVPTWQRVSSHSQMQRIYFCGGDVVESPSRWGWAQVADGRCSPAKSSTYTWNNPSTVKRQEVLRQSLTAKIHELLLMFGVIKSGPVLLKLSCGLVREGSHLLVNW